MLHKCQIITIRPSYSVIVKSRSSMQLVQRNGVKCLA